MNKGKELFFKYGNWFSKSDSLPLGISRSGIKIIFPFYHTVSDNALPHTQHLYTCPSIKKFKDDLDFMLKYFEPMHPDELENLPSIQKNKFLLSFDDGLKEMFEIVAPVLKQKGIPAIFFINSDFTDNKKLFYRYKVSVLIHKLKLSAAEKKRFLNFKYADIKEIDQYAEKNGIDFYAFLKNQQPYLSTMQIKKMSADGFIFGGHSIDHPQYSEISIDEQIRQTKESIQFVKQITGQEKNYFAFPFTDEGVNEQFFISMHRIRDLNLRYTFGTAGLRQPGDMHLQRIPMEIKNYSANQILNSEYRWYMIKKMLGR